MNTNTTTTTKSDLFNFKLLNAQADVRVAELQIENFGMSRRRLIKLNRAKAKLARITLDQLG